MPCFLASSIPHFAHVPAFPFAPLSLFWAKFQTGCDLSSIDAKTWIAEFQSQPVLLMQGGADTTIPPKSGERLFKAAHPPREVWFEPTLTHASFSTQAPAFEPRVVAFFDKYLFPDQERKAKQQTRIETVVPLLKAMPPHVFSINYSEPECSKE